jgi:C1A family cysteine protease
MARNVTPAGRGLGWKPDLPDIRDEIAAPPEVVKITHLPPKVDLRETGFMPPVYDQSQLGSCTANGIAAALDFDRKKQGLDFLTPSRLFIYYNERALEGTINDDAGAMIRDGIKVVNKQGACPESEWPYDIAKFKDRPTEQCYTDGLLDTALKYQRVLRSLVAFKAQLADGFPFVFGFSVYDSFESDEVAKTGMVPMPDPSEQMLGGHCVKAVGYDDSIDKFICRNSWGPDWGDGGYFYMPYLYLVTRSLSSDFWTISAVGAAA